MKLSARARYSIRLMIYLADNAVDNRPIGLKEIAEHQGLSLRYLEHLVVPLKRAALIRSAAGKHGGYILLRKPEAVTVGEIVEAALGPVRLLECLASNATCVYKDSCASRRMWGLINARMTDALHEYTLADLSEKKMREEHSSRGAPGSGAELLKEIIAPFVAAKKISVKEVVS